MIDIAVILVIFIASYILILKNFKLSLYVLIVLSVLLHKELFSFYTWDLMPVRIFMLGLLCAGITKLYFHIAKTKSLKTVLQYLKDPFVLILLLVWLTRGISIIFSANLQASLLLFGFLTTIVALGLYVYIVFKNSPQELLKYLKFYIYVVFALTIFGIVQLVLYEKTGKIIGALWNVPGKLPRIGSTFWDVNHYGSLIAAVLPVLGVFILTDKSWKRKIIDSVIFIMLCGSLLITNSRSAWMLGGFAFITFVTILVLKKFGAKGLLYILLAVIIIATPPVLMYQNRKSVFRAKVRDYFHYRIDSYDSHLMLLTGAIQIFEKYPIFGGGYGSFFEQFSKTKIAPAFFSRDPAALNTRVPAHTIWGESLSETGIVGTSVYILFCSLVLLAPLYVFFSEKDKSKSLVGLGMASAVLGWYIAGIFYSYNSEFFWIVNLVFLIWSIGMIGGEYLRKIVNFFFSESGFLLGLIGLISAYLIFINVGVNHLIPWDEAIYSKVAKNMVTNNQYVTLHWDNLLKPWYEKPPLFIWMQAGFMEVLGFTSFAAKLPSAILGLATVFLVFIIAKKFFNKTTAFISSLALITTVHFLYYSRMAMLDVALTFFTTISLFIYWLAKEKDKRYLWILSGLLAGLSVMVKGVVGFLPLLVIFLYELYLFVIDKQKFSVRLVLNYLLGFLSCLLVALPWHIYMYMQFGESFLKNYIGYHVLGRAFNNIEDKGRPFCWYLIVLKVSMRIWFIALLGAFPFTVFKTFKKDKRFVFLTLWALSMFLFFSIAKSKLIWYVIPLYPVLSLMVGNFIERTLDLVMRKVKFTNNYLFKFLSLYLLLVFSLFYLFLNREMVYTSDLNGSQARLLEKKDKVFGTKHTVYLDRIDFPTALYYSKSQFETLDFRPDLKERVPTVPGNEPLILITKEGRYSQNVFGYTQSSHIVESDGDWVLWYMSPRAVAGYVPVVEN